VDSHERASHDACYARMYSLVRYELRYIPDPEGVSGPHLPDGMCRVLEEKERKSPSNSAYERYFAARMGPVTLLR